MLDIFLVPARILLVSWVLGEILFWGINWVFEKNYPVISYWMFKNSKKRVGKMSHNLVFRPLRKGIDFHKIEFPFQTPTDLTEKVLAAKKKEAQFEILKNYVYEMYKDDVNKYKYDDSMLAACVEMRDELISDIYSLFQDRNYFLDWE